MSNSETISYPGWYSRLALAARTWLRPPSAQAGNRHKAIHSTVWIMAGTTVSQVLRAATTVILAREFLGPTQFGLVALVTIFVSGLSMLSDLGIGTDVVRHPRGDEATFLDTAYIIQAGRGIVLYGVAAGLAYPFALIYQQPKLFWLILAASSQVLIQGFTSSSIWTLTRGLRNDTLTILQVASDFGALVVAVTWAALSPTAWALVAAFLARPLIYAIGSFIVATRPFALLWDSVAARDIFAFGAGMFVSSFTFFFVSEAERLYVAKFITIAELGCFSLALTFSTLPNLALNKVISQVFYPLISESSRSDSNRAVAHYRKARILLVTVCLFFSVLFILFGQLIVNLLLGPKYHAAGWMLQLLGFRGAFQLFSSAATMMLFALGFSRYAAIGNIVRLAFLAMGLTIAFYFFGFRTAVWVLALSPVIAHIPLLFGLRRHFPMALRTELLTSLLFLVVSGGAGYILYSFRALFPHVVVLPGLAYHIP